MKKTLVCLAVATALGIGTANAQVAAILMPNPIASVITIGIWLYQNTEKVYYIEVEGKAQSFEAAKNAGLRLAVEQAIGSLISSESVVQNGKLVRDEIISYASGYVKNFEIVSKSDEAGIHTVKMKVWVKRSALANRLLGESKDDGKVEGDQASAQISTVMHERQTGDALLKTVLSDFPKRAFKIEVGKTGVTIDQSRLATLNVDFKLGWENSYLESLDAVLRATAQNKNPIGCSGWRRNDDCGLASYVTVQSGGFWSGWGGTYGYSDSVKFSQVVQKLFGSEPAVLVTVRDSEGKAKIRKCNHWAELDHQTEYIIPNSFFVELPKQNHVIVNNGLVLRGIAQLRVSSHSIQDATKVELEVIPGAQCPK